MQFTQLLSLAAVAAPLVSAAAVVVAPRDDNLSSTYSYTFPMTYQDDLWNSQILPVSYADAYLNETLSIADFGCGTFPAGTLLEKVRAPPGAILCMAPTLGPSLYA